MRYRAHKKLSRQRWRRRQRDPHQKQYVPLPFGWGHNYHIKIELSYSNLSSHSASVINPILILQLCDIF